MSKGDFKWALKPDFSLFFYTPVSYFLLLCATKEGTRLCVLSFVKFIFCTHMDIRKYFFCCCFFIPSFSFAQYCGSDAFLKTQISYAVMGAEHEASEQRAYHFFEGKGQNNTKKQEAIIPVVIHILHDDGTENITDAQVSRALQHLNDAFANTGFYNRGSGSAVPVRFCQAIRDPQGRAANGILRVKTPLTNLTIPNEALAKSLSYWPSQDYLNIWVVRSICWPALGCGVAAYASAPFFHGKPLDGIVIEADFFGTTPDKSVALIHEAGHYLGLLHTFEGGCNNSDCLLSGDRVCDTPPDQSTSNLPCGQEVNTCQTDTQSGFAQDVADATNNFMDYNTLECLHDFTDGQVSPMLFFLENDRRSLLESRGCRPPCPAPVTASYSPQDTVINAGSTITYKSFSNTAASYKWTVNDSLVSTEKQLVFTFRQEGVYAIELHTQSSNPADCPDARLKSTVQVVCPIQVEFSVNPSDPSLNESSVITNMSSGATWYAWSVNGVTTSDLTDFKFEKYGRYIFRLLAGNGYCQREKTLMVTLEDPCKGAVFEKIIDTPASDERGRASALLVEGSYIFGGDGKTDEAGRDIILLKTTPVGDILWTKRHGAKGDDRLYDLHALPEGGLLATGTVTDERGVVQGWVAHISAEGEIVWQKRTQAVTGGVVWKKITASNDASGYVICGYFLDPFTNKKSLCFLKFTAVGQILWHTGIRSQVGMEANIIQPSSFGQWFVAGSTDEADGAGTDGMIVGLDKNGRQATFCRTVKVKEGVADEALYGAYATSNFTQTGMYNTCGEIGNWRGHPSVAPGIRVGWILNFLTNGHIVVPKNGDNIGFGNTAFEDINSIVTTITAKDSTGGGATGFADIANKTMFMFPSPQPNGAERIQAFKNLVSLAGRVKTADGDSRLWWVMSTTNGFTGSCNQGSAPYELSPTEFVYTNLSTSETAPPAIETATCVVQTFSESVSTPCGSASSCVLTSCGDGWIKETGLVSRHEEITVFKAGPNRKLIAGGYRNDEIILIQFNQSGNVEWVQRLSGQSFPGRVNDVYVDRRGRWIAGGYILVGGLRRAMVLCYNPASQKTEWMWADETPHTQVLQTEETPGGNYLVHVEARPDNLSVSSFRTLRSSDGQLVAAPRPFLQNSQHRFLFKKIQRKGNFMWATGKNGAGAIAAQLDSSGLVRSVWQFLPPSNFLLEDAVDFTMEGDSLIILCQMQTNIVSSLTFRFALIKMAPDGTIIYSKYCNTERGQLFINNSLSPIFQVKNIVPLYDRYIVLGYYRSETSDYQYAITLSFLKGGPVFWATGLLNAVLRGDASGTSRLAAVNNDIFVGGASNSNFTDNDFFLSKLPVSSGRLTDFCGNVLNLQASFRSLIINTLSIKPGTFPEFNPSPSLVSVSIAPTALGQDRFYCTAQCQEVCNNGIDDDGNGDADCFDTACPCAGCEKKVGQIWHTGHRVSVNFETGSPVFSDESRIHAEGAVAVQCDPDGNLLFYVGGDTVWTRLHTPLSGAEHLKGSKQAASCLTFPIERLARYGIVTQQSSDVYFSVVEMRRQKNQGAVDLIRNIPINEGHPVVKYAGIACDSTYWVVMQVSGSDGWLAKPFKGAQPGKGVWSNAGAASRQIIAVAPASLSFGFLQLAVDQKIYMPVVGATGGSTLAVIEAPRERGTACLFRQNIQIPFATTAFWGMPQHLRQDIQQRPYPIIVGSDTLCGVPAKQTLWLSGASCADHIDWKNIFSSTSQWEQADARRGVWSTSTSGQYQIAATVSNGCHTYSDTLRITVTEGTTPELELGPDRTVCQGGVTTIEGPAGFSRYRWNDGSATPKLTTFSAGTYILEAWDVCGTKQEDTIMVSIPVEQQLELGEDRCLSGNPAFFRRPAGFSSWRWTPSLYISCDSCAEVKISPQKSVRYVVIAKNAEGCVTGDSILLNPGFLVETKIDTTVCADKKLPWGTLLVPPDTTVVLHLTSSYGCDSIVTVRTRSVPLSNLFLPADTVLKLAARYSIRSRVQGSPPFQYSWTPHPDLSCLNCPNPVFYALDSATLHLLVTDRHGCTAQKHINISVTDTCLVWYPNVFTPDGDGVNDHFYLLAYPCLKNIRSFSVVNRWGETVFQRTDMAPNEMEQGWDGYYNGSKAVTDVYIWRAEVEYYNGKTAWLQGSVTVLH